MLSEGLLSLQMRRQQEELARWRALEDAQRGGGRPTAARQLPESATRRRPPAAPRKEVAELQALVMERRELMSRQRQQRTEAGARTLALARDGVSRDPSPMRDEPDPLPVGGWARDEPPAPATDHRRAVSPLPMTSMRSTAMERVDRDERPSTAPADGGSPRSTAAVAAAARSRERADALELQLAQKEAALNRTRIAAERSAHLAAQAQAEAARLRGELDDARELRAAAMAEAREWRATAEASSEAGAMARGRERQLEDQIAQLHEALRAAQEAAEAAEASAQAVAARAFSADERRQLKEALEAAQRRADELSAQSSTMQARLSIRSEAAEAAAGAARHELMLKEHKLAELQARACDLELIPNPSLKPPSLRSRTHPQPITQAPSLSAYPPSSYLSPHCPPCPPHSPSPCLCRAAHPDLLPACRRTTRPSSCDSGSPTLSR